MDKDRIKKCFPFDDYYPYQEWTLEQAIQGLEDDKIVIIEAPPGSGKSPIAMAVARYFGGAHLCTPLKTLQDQYAKDFEDGRSVVRLKGRANYICNLLGAPNHAGRSPCIGDSRLKLFCRDRVKLSPKMVRQYQTDYASDGDCGCPYFNQRDRAVRADTTIYNFAGFLSFTKFVPDLFVQRPVLIVDEAHLMEQALMGFVSATLSKDRLDRLFKGYKYPTFPSHPKELDDKYWDYAEEILERALDVSVEMQGKIEHTSLTTKAVADLMERKQELEKLIYQLQEAFDENSDREVVMAVSRDSLKVVRRLEIKPVMVNDQTWYQRMGRRQLYMSGTIPPRFCESLGIPVQDAVLIRVPSSFPASNRPLQIRSGLGPLNYKTMTRDKMTEMTQEIANLAKFHQDSKGVIHTHTYRIANFIERNAPRELRKRLVHHNGGVMNREQSLEHFVNSKDPLILMSPSMAEGIDLKEDLARWQVICKMPYPSLGDPQIARRMQLDKAWYDGNVIIKVIQMYGRAVRSTTDYATCYVLDPGLKRLIRQYRDQIPGWFLEATIMA